MTSAELWRLKYVCYSEKLDEFVRRGGLCNSMVVPSYHLYPSADSFSFSVKSGSYYALNLSMGLEENLSRTGASHYPLIKSFSHTLFM